MILTILAGGDSSRMGRDKGAIEVAGEPLLLRTARIAGETGLVVAVVGRGRPDWWPSEQTDVVFIPDDAPGLGPAGGLATALRRFEEPILLLSCDLPLIDRETIDWLVANLPSSSGTMGGVLMRDHFPEPLLSYYRPSVMPLLEDRLAQGRRSLRGLLDEGNFDRIPLPTEMAGKIRGANTPDELERLLRGGR